MTARVIEPEVELAATNAALQRRLVAVAPWIVSDAEAIAEHAERGAGPLLDLLAREVRAREDAELVWLLLTAALAVFPDSDQVRWTLRALRSSPVTDALGILLQAGLRDPVGLATESEIRIVSGVVVDVDFCAKHRHNTGIQRVVRETVRLWDRDHDLTLVAWTVAGTAMRSLAGVEHDRILDWASVESLPDAALVDPPTAELIIPFRSTVVLPEVPQIVQTDALAGLAEFSGNTVAMIGYDMIPIVSPNVVSEAEIDKFSRYLTIVKHSDRIAGISAAAAEEFAGFSSAMLAQGLPGADAFAVTLPVDIPEPIGDPPPTQSRPMVLCVGSQEPRKNHAAVLWAAEALWREGLDFELVFIGGGSAENLATFDRRLRKLARAGHPVVARRGVDDAGLQAAYRAARFSIFPSIQEGYGLPVAESLAVGTPVISTNYGPTAEIGAEGGCVLVNPRSDVAIREAMRTLLQDDSELERLREEIRRRPLRSWEDYASELWQRLVSPAGGARA